MATEQVQRLLKYPDALIRFVLEANQTVDDRSKAIKKLKKYKTLNDVVNGNKKDAEILKSLDIYCNNQKRLILNSFLIADSDNEEIASSLQLDIKIIEVYRSYFFNIEVFESKLDKLAFVQSLPTEEKETYLYAINFGSEFLKWRVCGEPVKSGNLAKEIRDMFSLAKFNAKVASMNPITGEQSKEALRWMDRAIKLTDILAKFEIEEGSTVGEDGELSTSSNAHQDIIGLLIGVKNQNSVGSINDIDEDEVG